MCKSRGVKLHFDFKKKLKKNQLTTRTICVRGWQVMRSLLTILSAMDRKFRFIFVPVAKIYINNMQNR